MSDKETPWWYESESGQDRSEPSPVGTTAQEAIKLATAVSQWAERTGLSDALSGIAMQTVRGHDSTACDFCPVCQGVSLLRAVSPDAATGVAEALSAVTEAFRSAVDNLSQPPSSTTHVEHIDID